MTTVIKVENLSKVYRLYDNPTDRVKEALNIFSWKSYHRDFFALKDVSFEIRQGETVGIIGKNGSGKSTLLKIITGVLTPTYGNVNINGRVSALLELGTGFNPELTGIENVYFSGMIMGFTRKEMDAKLDNILSFADIGEFIKQPVKSYSSGMFARLAFALSIHVDPDILIVDEVLSVGDIAFQFKCFQRIKELKEKGVTILLVTHSTQQVLDHCNRAILLNGGKKLYDDYDVQMVVTEYEKLIRNTNELIKNKSDKKEEVNFNDISFDTSACKDINERRFGSHRAIIKDIIITDNWESNDDSSLLWSGRKTYFKFTINSKENINDIILGISIRGRDTSDLWGVNNIYAKHPINLKRGVNRLLYEIDLNINQGEFLVFCGLATLENGTREELDQRWPVKIIKVVSKQPCGGYIYTPVRVIEVD